MSCTKAQEFLAQQGVGIREQVNASRKLGKAEALKLAQAAAMIICARGQSSVRFNMRADPPDDATLLGHMLGPTANLRAPTIRVGSTLVVGFSEDAYAELLASGH